MNVQFTIELPEERVRAIREVARLAEQPIESVIAEFVQFSIPPTQTIDTELADVQSMSTIRLWATVQKGLGFPEALDNRMLELVQKGKDGIITDAEQIELDELIIAYDKYILLRTEALVELQTRGYDVQSYLKASAPKP